jgi:imidazolonepropionase-like amidohydrolase
MRSALIILLGAIVTAAPSRADPNSFAIHEVRVFDGRNVLRHANVVVRHGRVSAVARGAPIPAGLTVIEGSGKTLLPGLIDSHVHVYPGAQRDALRFGVTTVLDMFNVSREFSKWRTQRESLAPTMDADTWSAGVGVSPPGGHPQASLPSTVHFPTLARAADAPAFVAARVFEGSDYVKLFLEATSLLHPGESLPVLPRDAFCAAVAAAHAHGKLAIVHISEEKYAQEAIECGADGLAHVFRNKTADPDFINLAKRRHVFVETTLSVIAGISGISWARELASDPRAATYLSKNQDRSLNPLEVSRPELFSNASQVVRALHAAGVPLIAGTDAPGFGSPMGLALHGELQLLVKAGLTPREALADATSVPARIFHLPGRGCIARGCRADLVLVDGNPLREIRDTLSIRRIWKNGYMVDRGLPAPRPAPR